MSTEDKGRSRYRLMLVATIAVAMVYFLGFGVRLTLSPETVATFTVFIIAIVFFIKKSKVVDI